MLTFLAYEGKVAVVLLVFYLFYRFLLKKETFHRFNRVVLVSTAVLSFLLPLCIITIHKTVEQAPADILELVETVGGAAAGAPNVFRVDKGSLAGVREGAVVVAPEGLVGRVTAVSPHTADVTRITDRSVKVSCVVESGASENAVGILAGGSDDLLVLRHLTGEADPPPRSRVVTSGLGGVFPKGIEVGVLLGIRTDADGLSREGDVQPSVDFPELEDVFIRRGK